MVLQLGGCGRVGDCRIYFLGRALFVLDGALSCIHGCFLFMGGVVVCPLFVVGGGACPLLCQGRGGIRLMPVTIVLAVLATKPAARPRSIAHTPYVAHS